MNSIKIEPISFPSVYKYINENFFSYLQQIYGKKIVIPNIEIRKYYYNI